MCSHTDTKRASRVSCGKRAQKRAPHNLNAGMASSSVASSSSTKYIPFGDKKAQHGIIFLHGWKMSASSMKRSVAEALGGEPLPDTVFYFLTSPYTSEDGETRQWFSYLSDDRLSFSADDVISVRSRLKQIVHRLHHIHRRRGGTIALAGYSQGACMALDVALTMEIPNMRLMLFAGFAMLPRHVFASPWHGYEQYLSSGRPSAAKIKLWVYHGALDTEIGWGLARRSYDTLCSQGAARTVSMERVHVSEEDDHWSLWWEGAEACATFIRAFVGIEEEEEEEEEENGSSKPACVRGWHRLTSEEIAHARALGYDEDAWWNDEPRSISWDALMQSPKEREAALALGFTREMWRVDVENQPANP